MVARLPAVERSVNWKRTRFSYYTQHQTGSDYAQLIRENDLSLTQSTTISSTKAPKSNEKHAFLGNSPETLLDFESLVDESGYLDLGLTMVSPDENWLAYSVDTTGDEVFRMRFRDLRTGLDVEEIPRTYYGGAWSADSSYFFYTVHDRAYRPCEIWRHRIGTPANDDVRVSERAR